MSILKEDRQYAIWLHDMINLAFFSIINIINFKYFIEVTDYNLIGTTAVLGDSSSGHFLSNVLFRMVTFYTIFDIILVIVMPYCVASASPHSIVYHHIATLGLISLIVIDQRYQWYMSVTLLLEINTFILTLKRNISRPSIVYSILNLCFYATWLLLRNFLLPGLCYLFTFEYVLYSKKVHSYLNVVMIGPILIFALTILSFQWTIDMVKKLVVNKTALD